jgi:hypothetical protein
MEPHMARKPTDTVHLRLRFDEKLRRRLERAAAENKHSMNAEIVQRLEQSFREQDQRQLMRETAILAAETTLTMLGTQGRPAVLPGRIDQQEAAGPADTNQRDKAT